MHCLQNTRSTKYKLVSQTLYRRNTCKRQNFPQHHGPCKKSYFESVVFLMGAWSPPPSRKMTPKAVWRHNRPFPSSPGPLYQNEVRRSTILVEMSFICMRMKNHFHIKGWAPNLVLIQRPGGTRKWPIDGYAVKNLTLSQQINLRALHASSSMIVSILNYIPHAKNRPYSRFPPSFDAMKVILMFCPAHHLVCI